MEQQDWTFDRLVSLLESNQEENYRLEYKAGDLLNNFARNSKFAFELSKDVSAMANASGGTIIYGIAEQDGFPSRFDFVDSRLFTKERLEQMILTNIDPLFGDFKIHPIYNPNMPYDVIYVVDIQQGSTAYMAKDGKHWRRIGATTIQMDSAMLRDTLNRLLLPKLNLDFEIDRVIILEKKLPDPYFDQSALLAGIARRPMPENLEEPGERDPILTLRIHNIGSKLANYIHYKIIFPLGFLKNESNFLEKNGEIVYWGTNLIGGSSSIEYRRIPPKNRACKQEFYLNMSGLSSNDRVLYEIYCDDSEPQLGSIVISEIPQITERRYQEPVNLLRGFSIGGNAIH